MAVVPRCRRRRRPHWKMMHVASVHSNVSEMYVARISHGCYKSRSGCCIYCNGYTRILQAFVPNISSIFSIVCCKCVYLNVAYVSHIYCKCLIWMLRMIYNGFQVFSGVFATVSDACFKFFICFQTYIACMLNVSKVDRLFHLPPRFLLPCLGVSSS